MEQVKDSRSVEENSKAGTTYKLSQRQMHRLGDADGRIPLQSTVTGFFISAVKKEMWVNNYSMEGR